MAKMDRGVYIVGLPTVCSTAKLGLGFQRGPRRQRVGTISANRVSACSSRPRRTHCSVESRAVTVAQAAVKASLDGAMAVTTEALEWARDKIAMGPERRSAMITKETAQLTAYHEGGHAIVVGAFLLRVLGSGVIVGLIDHLTSERKVVQGSVIT